jgi:uncharacterized membrane protein
VLIPVLARRRLLVLVLVLAAALVLVLAVVSVLILVQMFLPTHPRPVVCAWSGHPPAA